MREVKYRLKAYEQDYLQTMYIPENDGDCEKLKFCKDCLLGFLEDDTNVSQVNCGSFLAGD